MTQIAQPSTMPLNQTATAGDVISPAEAKFWAEWANKTPELLYKNVVIPTRKTNSGFNTTLAVSVGAALGIATFTKYVPGKWKWATGAGAAAAFVLGGLESQVTGMKNAYTVFAAMLQTSPELKNELGLYLSKVVTAEDIQKFGIEHAVMMRAAEFSQALPKERVEALANQMMSHEQRLHAQNSGGGVTGMFSPMPGMML